MPEYSEQDLRYAAELREEIHKEALAIVRKTRPDVTEVTDRHPVEDYFQEHWDYPGKRYTVVAIPYGYKSRRAFVDAIVRDTLAGKAPEEEPPDARDRKKAQPERERNEDRPGEYEELFAEYPDLVVDYGIVKGEGYGGYDSHRRALKTAFDRLDGDWEGDPDQATGKSVDPANMFSSQYEEGKLNYRKAFLYPPYENGYTGKDFARVNAALFPNGTDELEVYKWTTDWSEYFDEGREWWGTLCLTVYDKTLDRFVVIMASATD